MLRSHPRPSRLDREVLNWYAWWDSQSFVRRDLNPRAFARPAISISGTRLK